MKELFDCDDVGEMKEYVGCKVDYNHEKRYMQLTQPVFIQSLEDEFDWGNEGPVPKIPAEAGTVLTEGKPVEERNLLPKTRQTNFRNGVGKLLHMMRSNRPELIKFVRVCSKNMKGAAEAHMVALKTYDALYCRQCKAWTTSTS